MLFRSGVVVVLSVVGVVVSVVGVVVLTLLVVLSLLLLELQPVAVATTTLKQLDIKSDLFIVFTPLCIKRTVLRLWLLGRISRFARQLTFGRCKANAFYGVVASSSKLTSITTF